MTTSDEPLPKYCVSCTNKLSLYPDTDLPEYICPFCGSVVWPATATAPLSEIGDFNAVRPIDWEAPAVVFEAMRHDERFLITLLGAKDQLYTAAKSFHDLGNDDPYGVNENAAHPNLLRTYPFQWINNVAIASMEYIDGKSLLEWIAKVGPIDVSDAVSIALACVRAAHHTVGQTRGSEINQKTIHVTQNGEIKIKAYCGVTLTPFEPSPQRLIQREMKSHQTDKPNRIGMGIFQAPESFRAEFRMNDTDEELLLRQVYCLGCLLFELVTDQPTPNCQLGVNSIRNLELIPVHEIQAAAPVELSTIVNRMTAFDPSQRYQDFVSLIDDLEALNIDAPTVSFVNRTGPPVNEAAIQKEIAKQWVSRTDGYDFRKIKWGMTQDEILDAEPSDPTLAAPGVMMFNTSYHDQSLLLVYRFAEDEGKLLCVGVSVQQDRMNHRGYMESEPDFDDVEDLVKESNALQEEIKQLKQNSAPDEIDQILQKLVRDRKRRRGSLDTVAVNAAYETFKKLIMADYGEPDMMDGPLNEDPEYIKALDDHGDPNNPDDYGDCKSTNWETESTYITLSIGPQPFGDRAISASIASMKHGRLIPGHPDFDSN